VIFSVWGVFWLYWLLAAFSAKRGASSSRRIPATGLLFLVAFVLARVFSTHTMAVHSVVLQVIGTVLFAAGLAVCVWARIYLGRNWGMPMTKKAEPELVTSGPYRYVRHPIYSGILLALLGTAFATNPYLLILVVLAGAYFVYSATVEERLMTDSFPAQYGQYKAGTKMLIPFVL
jgi:protein-S-isoprenylcysteine O-methyltransferase Ste14